MLQRSVRLKITSTTVLATPSDTCLAGTDSSSHGPAQRRNNTHRTYSTSISTEVSQQQHDVGVFDAHLRSGDMCQRQLQPLISSMPRAFAAAGATAVASPTRVSYAAAEAPATAAPQGPASAGNHDDGDGLASAGRRTRGCAYAACHGSSYAPAGTFVRQLAPRGNSHREHAAGASAHALTTAGMSSSERQDVNNTGPDLPLQQPQQQQQQLQQTIADNVSAAHTAQSIQASSRAAADGAPSLLASTGPSGPANSPTTSAENATATVPVKQPAPARTYSAQKPEDNAAVVAGKLAALCKAVAAIDAAIGQRKQSLAAMSSLLLKYQDIEHRNSTLADYLQVVQELLQQLRQLTVYRQHLQVDIQQQIKTALKGSMDHIIPPETTSRGSCSMDGSSRPTPHSYCQIPQPPQYSITKPPLVCNSRQAGSKERVSKQAATCTRQLPHSVAVTNGCKVVAHSRDASLAAGRVWGGWKIGTTKSCTIPLGCCNDSYPHNRPSQGTSSSNRGVQPCAGSRGASEAVVAQSLPSTVSKPVVNEEDHPASRCPSAGSSKQWQRKTTTSSKDVRWQHVAPPMGRNIEDVLRRQMLLGRRLNSMQLQQTAELLGCHTAAGFSKNLQKLSVVALQPWTRSAAVTSRSDLQRSKHAGHVPSLGAMVAVSGQQPKQALCDLQTAEAVDSVRLPASMAAAVDVLSVPKGGEVNPEIRGRGIFVETMQQHQLQQPTTVKQLSSHVGLTTHFGKQLHQLLSLLQQRRARIGP